MPLCSIPSSRAACQSKVYDEESALVMPYIALLQEESAQRDHDFREVFNGLRYLVETGSPCRFKHHDLLSCAAV